MTATIVEYVLDAPAGSTFGLRAIESLVGRTLLVLFDGEPCAGTVTGAVPARSNDGRVCGARLTVEIPSRLGVDTENG